MYRRKAVLLAVPILFGAFGYRLGGGVYAQRHDSTRVRPVELEYPLPHHIPKYPGNLTLRFAMVHDVIHERFPHHGADYYRARNDEVQQRLETLKPTAKGKEADEYFRLIDDQGVGLEFLGRHKEAVDLMRDKLKRQEALGYEGRELYSTYANLGTILILWQLTEGVDDVPKAKERIGESVGWIHKAIEVYPQSHFGRESWQVVLEEFLLAVLDNPDLLLKYDMIGNSLGLPVARTPGQCFDERAWLQTPGGKFPTLADEATNYLSNPNADSDTSKFRQWITPLGAEGNWRDDVKSAHREPVRFDEPTLGIVGMWRMGSGANPHFALVLGEIMERVGQRYIAWTAFERACGMKDHIWSDPRIQEEFAAHCRLRQLAIEERLPQENWNAVRDKFEKELAFGQAYQKEYQEYESRRIAEGTRTDDPHFYDAFETQHGPVATSVGNEDKAFSTVYSWRIFFAGLLAFAAAANLFSHQKRRAIAPRTPSPVNPTSQV